ncbi:MATE family efflux transporter [Thioclava sp. GXIMD2076]|uniref:MATE family efflux transporter n=1 Tax=unclassified Thioclava TaxID=2621713 RepID=UPI0030D449AE
MPQSHRPDAPNRLTTGSIPWQLALFALPTLGSSVLQSAGGSIDSAWVGNLIGEAALAATTNGNLIMFLLVSFVFGFGMAATILIGQAIGRGALGEARRIVGTAVGCFLPLAVVVAGAGYVTAPHLLALLGTDPQIEELARSYLQLTFVAMPGILMQTMLMMVLRGSGDSLTPLYFMIMAVVLAAVLNPCLILGLGPLPELGIGGSAISLGLANYVSLVAMLAYIYLRDLPLRLRGAELRFLIPDGALLRQIVAKGLPIGLQMVVVTTAALTVLRLINNEGVDTTAAYGAVQQIWTYVQMPAMALGAAVSAMAAQNIGAGRFDRVARITGIGVVFNIALTGGLIVLLLLADRYALSIFLTGGGDALEIGRHVLLVATWGYVAFGVSQVVFGTVRANGKVIPPLIILAVALYPVRLGFVWALGPSLGADAIWWSFPVAFSATMVMGLLYYRFGHWRPAHSDRLQDPQKPPIASPSDTQPDPASCTLSRDIGAHRT